MARQDFENRQFADADLLATRTALVGADGEPLATSADGELQITSIEQEKNNLAAYTKQDVSATTYAVLVDLSDTTNWPHDATGRADLSYVSFQVDRASSTVGRLSLGVITRVDGTDADVVFFRGLIFQHGTETFLERAENFAPSQIKCGVSGGATTHLLVAETTGIAAINTATPLDSPLGTATVTPAPGDLVVRFQHDNGGAWTGAVSVLYHAQDTA